MTDEAPPVRVALFGCGWVVETSHVPALLAEPSTRITALVDQQPSRSAAISALVGARVRCFGSAAELLAAGPAPDLAVVATPTADHPAVIDALVAQGVPVLCEKPLAPTAESARALTNSTRHVKPSVVHSHLYRRVVRSAVDVVADPAFGAPRVVRVRILLPARPVGRGRDQHWRSDPAGGGCVRDLGYHAIYLAEALHGAPIVGVRAMTTGSARAAEDHALSIAEHAHGGHSVLEVGWHTAVDEFQVAVTSREAELRTTDDGELLLRQRGNADAVVVPLSADGLTPYRRLYRDAVARLRTGAEPGASPGDAVHCLDVVDAWLASAARGCDTVVAAVEDSLSRNGSGNREERT